ncbi:substrate-binding domain-containing protein [Aquimarina brevivitae]|uniref:ABC-type nitrate/sulfonate/bicarbonate transport system substrate-binding protein n=1 Tax=Aquimarina brevivitae TaxID=323412 RepID=A0A4Q7NW89_9FLAO|nr:substrate-binding domain-containing protein [Aquimarina brevivitae]RZS90662.1 ABC-type nitrate/sulfonate/bicarbonate transport system substrate-binding protein [Aquimarina brevivitae]
MKNIKIGGVPEHFNLPWHNAIEDNLFKKKDINLIWRDIPEGTGAMCQALRNKELDMAIILTEGIVKDITAGNPSKILQTYVTSPLIWGIHVAAKSTYQHIKELQGTTAAISRYGSGSHLMAYVQAENEGWDTNALDFQVVHHLQGAIDALTIGQADYFMWEHFTTKPLVDKGVFRRLGDCPTPWPCFVIAAHQEFIANNMNHIKTVLSIINEITDTFKRIPDIDKIIASKYDQKLIDVKEWLKITEWSQSQLDEHTLEEVQQKLLDLNIINTKVDKSRILL